MISASLARPMLPAALLASLAGIAGSLELMWEHFAVGGALLFASVLLLRWPRSIWSDTAVAEPSPRVRRVALVGVCLLAVFFRVYQLNQPGLWGDDALNGLLAYAILDGRIHSPFELVLHSHSTFHALSNYPIAAAFWLFGADLTTLRLPGIVMSILCVALLYGTIAPLFGSTTALIAALFCACSPPQLTHAKELVQIITGQFFQLAGLCLLVRGISGRRSWMIAASGLPLALCLYTYHSARAAPLVAVVYALAWIVVGRRSLVVGPRETGEVGEEPYAPTTQRSSRTNYALAGALLVFILGLIPAVPGYVHDPSALVRRVGDTSIVSVLRDQHSLWPLWENTWRTLLMFHYRQGPEYHWFGVATDPGVDVVIGFLFLHGLVESLARWRQPRHVLLLAWFTIGLLPALVSSGAPRLYRAFFALPPVYVWAALPLARMAALPAPHWSRRGLRAVAVALAAAVPLIDFNYYFYRVYTNPTFRWYQGERIVEMARTLRDFGAGWTGYLLADAFDTQHEDFRFLSRAWGLKMVTVTSLTDVLPLPNLPERGALFIMSQGLLGAQAAVQQMYPGGEFIVRREPAVRSWWFDALWPLASSRRGADVSAAFYAVDRAVAEHPKLDPPWGLEVEYNVGGQRIRRREAYPFSYFLTPPFRKPYDAVWRGRLTIPDPGDYYIIVATNADATLSIDGRVIGAHIAIPAGEHDFVLQLRAVPSALRLRISWERSGMARALIPPHAFGPP